MDHAHLIARKFFFDNECDNPDTAAHLRKCLQMFFLTVERTLADKEGWGVERLSEASGLPLDTFVIMKAITDIQKEGSEEEHLASLRDFYYDQFERRDEAHREIYLKRWRAYLAQQDNPPAAEDVEAKEVDTWEGETTTQAPTKKKKKKTAKANAPSVDDHDDIVNDKATEVESSTPSVKKAKKKEKGKAKAKVTPLLDDDEEELINDELFQGVVDILTASLKHGKEYRPTSFDGRKFSVGDEGRGGSKKTTAQVKVCERVGDAVRNLLFYLSQCMNHPVANILKTSGLSKVLYRKENPWTICQQYLKVEKKGLEGGTYPVVHAFGL